MKNFNKMFENLEESVLPNQFQVNLACIAITASIVLWHQKSVRLKKTVSTLQPQRQIQGPSVLETLKLLNMKNLLPLMDEWTKRYKDLFQFKFGPYRVVFLNSAELVQKLLASKEPGHLPKPFFYEPLRPFLGDGILLSHGEKWKSRRKLLTAHMFSYKTLSNTVKIFNEEANNLVEVLNVSSSIDFPMPIEDLLMKATLGPIVKMVFGQQAETVAVKTKYEEETLEIAKKAKKVFITKALNPMLLINPLWQFHPLYKTEKEILNFINKLALEALDSEFVFKEELQAAGVPLDGIFEEGWTLLVAGYETTATGLHFLLFLLALHPSHQEICRQEVDNLFEELDENHYISLEVLKRFTYLEMCMNETLRLIPVIPFFLRKITVPLDLGNGVVLPANTTVGIYTNAIHKNPQYYPDPKQFIPERFSKEASSKRHPYEFIPFSGGPRVCIGQKYATTQILIFAAKILRHYQISTTTKPEEIVFRPLVTSVPETPMKFVFEKRK